jgi:hypothetical protein
MLETPLSDHQISNIAKYVRAYTDGALTLMSGYIHSILPPPTKILRDIRQFFRRKSISSANPPPASPADTWQPARHGIKRPVETTQQSSSVPTTHPFSPLDDDDEAHSEDFAAASIPSSTASPKRADVLRRR